MRDEKLRLAIEEALDSVRPHLKEDGGNVEVIELNPNGVLTVKWLGTCRNCEMSQMTLKAGIEQTIIQKIPEIKEVKAVL